MDKIVLLDIDEVDPPSEAVRDLIDPEGIRELAESIRSQGLLQPILVRPFSGRYEVVAGHRRLLGHRLIGKTKIRAFIKDLSDEETLLIRAVENIQRKDLTPIEQGKIYKILREKLGYSLEKMAQKMGKTKPTIIKYLKILEIPEEFRKNLNDGSLGVNVAITLLEIDDPEFRRYYLKNAVENGVTVSVAQMWVEDYRKVKENQPYSEGGGRGVSTDIPPETPRYQTCHCCHGPVDVSQVRYFPLCPKCGIEISGSKAL
ncbi:MAG: ParB/RepB/Spo0J family partition protein [Pseudomonadota bacterium]